jgi:putative endonuclease
LSGFYQKDPKVKNKKTYRQQKIGQKIDDRQTFFLTNCTNFITFAVKSKMIMAEHNILGKDGENAATEYLKRKGYNILHTNWRYRHYELDIVANTADELVFVEVKTRSANPLTTPESAITNTKIRNIVDAADFYIKHFDIELPARFDIISLIGMAPNFEIDHIEDAFTAPISKRW